jgi:hypothetical protein
VINSFRSERGWRGRRRIAVLVSLAGVLGIAALGSAGTASAATVANCNAKLEPNGKGNGTKAKLSFVCDSDIRAYSVGSNKPIKDYTNPSGGNASAFFTCEGSGAGFGCGILNRADPGSQTPGTTGWSSTFPPAPSATATPTTCGGFTRIAGAGTTNPDPDNDGTSGPNINGVVGAPCSELITAGTRVQQSITLGSSPCSGGSRNPLQLYLLVGGEPLVTGLAPPSSIVSTTVGEYLQSPTKVNLSAFKHRCGKAASGGNGKHGGGKKSSAPATTFPVSCSGSISPSTTPGDQTLTFTCNQNIRAFAIYSNKLIDLPGDEPEVTGTAGGGVNEGALHQCEGDFPGSGYGCGIVDRQQQATSLPNGQGISAGNEAKQTLGFDQTPCTRPGEVKPKAWLVVMGEPTTSATTVGEFTSAPTQLALTGFGKCKGGKGHGKKK